MIFAAMLPFVQNIRAASDAFVILGVVTECVKEYNLDRVDSTPAGAPAISDEKARFQFYVQRALAENLALKHCQNARAMLHPMLKTADPEMNKSIALLDSSFEIRQRIHNHALEMIDRVSSGRGHADISEVGKAGADAIEALNMFTNSTIAIFSKLTPLLTADERKLLSQQIAELFPNDQKSYDKNPPQAHLAEEVLMIMLIRDRLLSK